MPAFLEDHLRHAYAKKGLTGRALDRAVYGTMNNIGVMHGNKETAKGVAMDRTHALKVKDAIRARV